MTDFQLLNSKINNIELRVEDVEREYTEEDETGRDAILIYLQIAQDQEEFRKEFEKWFNRRENISKDNLLFLHEFYQKHLFDIGWNEIAAQRIFDSIISVISEGG